MALVLVSVYVLSVVLLRPIDVFSVVRACCSCYWCACFYCSCGCYCWYCCCCQVRWHVKTSLLADSIVVVVVVVAVVVAVVIIVDDIVDVVVVAAVVIVVVDVVVDVVIVAVVAVIVAVFCLQSHHLSCGTTRVLSSNCDADAYLNRLLTVI
jgi:hypothetical protein